jgi:hypothetical protein
MELRQKIVDTVDRQLGAYRPYGVGWSGLNSLQKKTRLAQEADPVERAAFRKKQRRLNVWRLVFVDEVGINRAMSRIYARAPRGARAHQRTIREGVQHFS